MFLWQLSSIGLFLHTHTHSLPFFLFLSLSLSLSLSHTHTRFLSVPHTAAYLHTLLFTHIYIFLLSLSLSLTCRHQIASIISLFHTHICSPFLSLFFCFCFFYPIDTPGLRAAQTPLTRTHTHPKATVAASHCADAEPACLPAACEYS